MIVIKRGIIFACGALVVLAIVLSIVLTSCNGKNKNNETISDTSGSSSYTQSEIDEIKDWWSSAIIEEDGNTSITTK